MGQDKGSMIINGKPMILHILLTLNKEIDELIIVLNNTERIKKYEKIISNYKFDYEILFVEDFIKNKGPLSGILTGLKYVKEDFALVLPCDSPFISKKLINYLFNEFDNKLDCTVPFHNLNNKLETSEPLHSIYKKSNIKLMEKQINNNILNIKALIKILNCKFIPIDNKKLLKKDFKNLNTEKDVFK